MARKTPRISITEGRAPAFKNTHFDPPVRIESYKGIYGDIPSEYKKHVRVADRNNLGIITVEQTVGPNGVFRNTEGLIDYLANRAGIEGYFIVGFNDPEDLFHLSEAELASRGGLYVEGENPQVETEAA